MIKDEDNISKWGEKRDREKEKEEKHAEATYGIVFSSQNQSSTLPSFVKKQFEKHSLTSTWKLLLFQVISLIWQKLDE